MKCTLLGLLFISVFTHANAASAPAVFDWFEYTGRDSHVNGATPYGMYLNPILAGFYADPSICRVGDDYYLVNSSFAYFPGVPIFKSSDLVHWTQLGHVLDRPSQLKLDGMGVSRGIFAPVLRFHDGLFYMITTMVDAGGNFFVTAKNPAGPWSEPTWLPEVDGIDPSFFFDENNRAYIINNGPPPDNHPLYEGHRAIWIQAFDLKRQCTMGPRTILVNGGVDLAKKPVWIEGPHLFKRGDWYYLISAEGGTGPDHSEVVFRSRTVTGPFVPWDQNPILTQRDLDPRRPAPVTSTGHVDFVETQTGDWWSIFLGCRPYAGDFYNTGRETFLLPITWQEGWPKILDKGVPVPLVHAMPKLPLATHPAPPLTGNFTWRDEFEAPTLNMTWNFLRTPREAWFSLTENPGALTLHSRAATLSGRDNPSFVGRRQQHADFVSTTALRCPLATTASAGMVAFQNETHHFFLGVKNRGGRMEVFLECANGGEPTIVATAEVPLAEATILLKIEAHGRQYSFSYAVDPNHWKVLKSDADGTILSTQVAGGFVGTYLGLYARTEG
ncbi:MAG TPA: glycoside hydrolase family 43 protein [Opitutaceae bacterium]|nr:glycoside hydrolase family 43 protein [Opitutaceae bacterium]